MTGEEKLDEKFAPMKIPLADEANRDLGFGERLRGKVACDF